ncbi:MAG TPA: GntR family transcriptional regulator [Planctomycetota bacterium]|jgi:DNA-binding GntR family transcriptional regulator
MIQPGTLPRPSLRDQIRETLLSRIGQGKLAPGDRIVEAALGTEFGVSSIPVREAIRELVAMGVLEFANHKGAWVRQVSLAETIEALEVKSILEGLAGRLAAPRLRGKCRHLHRCCAAILAASRKGDLVAYQNHNQVFHRTIIEASGNKVLLKTWNTLAFEVRTRPILQFLAKQSPVAIAREHQQIADALDAGHGARARILLALHSDKLVEHLRREMASPSNGNEEVPVLVSKRTRTPSRKKT